MKVLTFCAYFEPEIAASMYLTVNLLEGAAAADMEVEVFAPTPTRGVDRETIQKYKKIREENRYGDKVHIHRFSMMQEGKGTLGRAIRYILLNLAFVWKGLRTKADVMFIDSTPPTQGFMAAFLKKIKKIPIVYNLQDIFPDSLVNTGIAAERSLAFRIGRWVENVTYRNADKIIVISEDFKRNILAKGVPEEKIVVVPNWVDSGDVHHVPREENILFDRYGLDRAKFYVCYSGNIGFTQNLELLTAAAKRMEAEIPDVRFALVGDGAAREQLEQTIEKENIGNIVLLPFQPYEEIAHVFSLGDAGLVISKAGVGNNSVPSKTWSIMAAERPIIASFDKDSELCKLVGTVGCGVTAPADDLDALVDAIRYIYENQSRTAEMGEKGRKYICEELDKDKCVGQYLRTIRSCAEAQEVAAG